MAKAKTERGDQALEERRREVDNGETLHRDLRPVDVERPREPQATFALRLAPEDVAEIRRLARDRGLGPTQLVRSWVVERIHAPAPPLDDGTIKQIVDQLRPGLTDVVRERPRQRDKAAWREHRPSVAPGRHRSRPAGERRRPPQASNRPRRPRRAIEGHELSHF